MLLALNTATPQLSMALVEDGQVLAHAVRDVGNEHSEAVFTLLETLFAWSGRSRESLTGLGVCVGPGGFTGLRTGLSVAKTLAQVLNRPIYGVDTLEALAAQFPGPTLVSAMLDARRNLVFAGLYRSHGDAVETLLPGRLYPVAEWEAKLAEYGDAPILAVGEGAMRHRERFEAHANWVVPPDALMVAGAVTVALLAEGRLRAGQPSELAALAPVYLREPQAVVNWEAAQQAKARSSVADGLPLAEGLSPKDPHAARP